MVDLKFKVSFYSEHDFVLWEKCVQESPIGTIQHSRKFLNHHKQKFDDFSILIRDSSGHELVAVMPIAINSGQLESHPGAAFGGLVPCRKLTLVETRDLFLAVSDFLVNKGFQSLLYKPVPNIFHLDIWEEDVAALTSMGSLIQRSHPYQYIDLKKHKLRRGGNRKLAQKLGCSSQLTSDAVLVHKIIARNLLSQHKASPTHSLEDFLFLSDNFADVFFHVVTFFCSLY